MTKDMMARRGLLENSGDTDLPREMIGFAAERLPALAVGAHTGAALGEKSPTRLARRNGYRDRTWETRAGTVGLRLPRRRTGSYFPSFLEPRRMAEKALTAVVQEAYIQGVSTRLRTRLPKLAALTDSAEEDAPACMSLPSAHGTKPRSCNPLERLNGEIKHGEIKRQTEVAGIFPEPSMTRLVGALLLEQADDRAVQRPAP